jgi:hypothetical protein
MNRWLNLIDQGEFDSRLNQFLKTLIAFLRQLRYSFRAETITGQGLVVPHQSRKRYSSLKLFEDTLPNKAYNAKRTSENDFLTYQNG